MSRKIKKLSISAVAILLVLSGFGAFTLVRTARKEITYIQSAEGSKVNASVSAAKTFSDDFEQLIPHERKLNSIVYYATGIFNSNHVIWGKDDWLFYSSTNSGDPIADYTGSNSFSQPELEQAKENMLSIQDSLLKRNIKFCLLVPPNKENVYSQYMPQKYKHTDKTRTDVLVEYLHNNGVNVVDAKEELITFDSKYRTYYKQDTHWNELGAYIATQKVLDTFDAELPDIDEGNIVQGDTTISDLADMVGLTNVFPNDYGFTSADIKQVKGNITEESIGEVKHYHNEKATQNESVLLIGDSFREAMVPAILLCFNNVYVVTKDLYSQDIIRNIEPNYVVLETVERLSDYAISFKIV